MLFARERDAPDGRGTRLGITASRKVGPAVIRSRCRRRVRELFRLSTAAHWPWPLDLVVNVRPGCDRVEWKELVAEWERLTARIATAVEGRGAAGERTSRVRVLR